MNCTAQFVGNSQLVKITIIYFKALDASRDLLGYLLLCMVLLWERHTYELTFRQLRPFFLWQDIALKSCAIDRSSCNFDEQF